MCRQMSHGVDNHKTGQQVILATTVRCRMSVMHCVIRRPYRVPCRIGQYSVSMVTTIRTSGPRPRPRLSSSNLGIPAWLQTFQKLQAGSDRRPQSTDGRYCIHSSLAGGWKLCCIAQHTETAPARPYPRRHMYIRTPDTVLRTHRFSGCVIVHYTYYSSKLCRVPSRGCWLTLIVSSGGFVVRTCNLTFVSLDFETPGRETVTCQLQALTV